MILSHEEYLKLPVIALRELTGNEPVDYTPFQIFLLPYIDIIQTLWWVGFAATLVFLAARFLIIPLTTGRGSASFAPFVMNPLPAPTADATGEDFWTKFKQGYYRLFSLKEIEQDMALRLYGGSILIGYLVSFKDWQMEHSSTIDAIRTHGVLCWGFFQSCADWLWLRTLPYGYSQTILYMLLFATILMAGYSLIVGKIMRAHACIFALFIVKLYFVLITLRFNGNFDYYHNLFNIVFLFLPYKRFFGSLMVVWCYFLSTATKIHPSWTWGGYFTSMRGGLPMIPRGAEPFFTNLIIFMEMFMAWFMFSPHKKLQRAVFAFFVFFHLYSGTLVGFRYPTIVMPPLLIFFGPLFSAFPGVPLGQRSIPGWILVTGLLAVQMYSHTIPGDTKLTLQGNHYGLYMFEANHQCRVRFIDEQGKIIAVHDTADAHHRCDPWLAVSAAQQTYCQSEPRPTIKMGMIHSINGGPFYEIVNEADMCALHYKAFSKNDWIKDETTAPIVGRPLENFYR